MDLTIAKLDSTEADFQLKLMALLTYQTKENEVIERTTSSILAAIKARGDAAILEYTNTLDHLNVTKVSDLELNNATLQTMLAKLPKVSRNAMLIAANRIKTYHERQQQECGVNNFSYEEIDGTILGQKITPIDRVGIYIPGGKAAYPSSVLMNAIPAKVAGVKEIIMMVPTPYGIKNELVLAAAAISNVNRVFTIGGAQAIGALAYGTSTIPQVDKIVGPGNAYVTAAKRCVFGMVGIDMIAGPSEILIICDGSTDPDWIVMDLFAQAEHDELAQAILLCPDATYINNIEKIINRQLDTMLRKKIIYTSLCNRGALIKVRDMNEACEIANQIAAEHVEISTEEPQQWANKIRHAGAIFLGRFSSESLGDYCMGPNHVLPTSRTARFFSPLGVYDFQKRSNIIHVSQKGAQVLGKVAAELAYGEGLQAHARSAELRFNKINA